jgi:hypothetical protein
MYDSGMIWLYTFFTYLFKNVEDYQAHPWQILLSMAVQEITLQKGILLNTLQAYSMHLTFDMNVNKTTFHKDILSPKKEGDWISTRKIQQDNPQDRVPWFFSHIDKTADTTHALNNPHSYSTAEH